MRVKAPSPIETDLDGKQRQLKAFVIDALGSLSRNGPDTILVLARAAGSEATRLLSALSAGLRDRGIGARIVIACPHGISMQPLDLAPGFAHEIRIAGDIRMLGAHEQFVVGASAVWYGDSMRRDPNKKDAFASYHRDETAAVVARRTFLRLWSSNIRRYTETRPAAAAAAVIAGQAAGDTEALPEGMIESLNAWVPSLRH